MSSVDHRLHKHTKDGGCLLTSSSPSAESAPRVTEPGPGSLTEPMLALAASLGLAEPSIGTRQYFHVLAEAADLHVRKVRGYGSQQDAWKNFRRAENLGMTPLMGVALRMGDKMSRIENLIRDPSNDLLGEKLEAELFDMAGYSNIGICLVREDT